MNCVIQNASKLKFSISKLLNSPTASDRKRRSLLYLNVYDGLFGLHHPGILFLKISFSFFTRFCVPRMSQKIWNICVFRQEISLPSSLESWLWHAAFGRCPRIYDPIITGGCDQYIRSVIAGRGESPFIIAGYGAFPNKFFLSRCLPDWPLNKMASRQEETGWRTRSYDVGAGQTNVRSSVSHTLK